MRRLALGGLHTVGEMQRALKTIEQASYEDVETVFDEVTVTSATTPDRWELDLDTGTVEEMFEVLATIIIAIQKRGSRRDPNEA